MEAKTLPEQANQKNITWSSNNSDILKVDGTGKITAVRAGEFILTVKDTVSGNSDSVRILTAYALERDRIDTPEKLKVTKCTDFKDNYLSWNKITGAGTRTDGVKVSDEYCTEAESGAIMNQYKIEGIVHSSPYLKYHMTKDTLYIHLYVEFCSYSKEDKAYLPVPEMTAVFRGRRPGDAGRYQEIFTDGVKRVYDTVVTGLFEGHHRRELYAVRFRRRRELVPCPCLCQ